jgi:hypothetical protein
VVRTPSSHVGNAGSTPAGITNQKIGLQHIGELVPMRSGSTVNRRASSVPGNLQHTVAILLTIC